MVNNRGKETKKISMSKDAQNTKLTFHQVKFADIKEWDVTKRRQESTMRTNEITPKFTNSFRETNENLPSDPNNLDTFQYKFTDHSNSQS